MKITPAVLARELGFSVLAGGQSLERAVDCAYSCDLLSFVMGRAPAGCAWVTVMGNVNAVAVAVLADCACVILADGVALDPAAKEKAEAQDVAVLSSGEPVFETALAVHELLSARQ
ncbi:MAG: DRTGG domain-containing protein [Oscillospiraceae bacterium]|nr:DRTGG domain-containing protein [Oscillospiraceae bacterium]